MKSNQKNARVLVTGISGFLGTHLAVQLLQQGYDVKGTVRSTARIAETERIIRSQPGAQQGSLTFAVADLTSDAGWDEAMNGCDYVQHVASPFLSQLPKHEDELIKPAKEGTIRVLRAAKKAGVKRVVLTSSLAAVVYNENAAPYDESHWTQLDHPASTAYYRSKTIAERAAWELADTLNLDLTVINPGLMLGPVLGSDYGTSADAIRLMLSGTYPGIPKIGFSVVDVRDVALAHILAMQNDTAPGQRFVAAGRFMWMSEIAEVLRAAYPDQAKKIPRRALPDWLVRVLGRFDAATATVAGDLSYNAAVSNAKARRVLGWQPRAEAEAIRATADSLMQYGHV